MATTTAAFRREDHRCVSTEGRERARRLLLLPTKVDSLDAPPFAISVLSVIVPPCPKCGRSGTKSVTPFRPVYSDSTRLFCGRRPPERRAGIYRIETVAVLILKSINRTASSD